MSLPFRAGLEAHRRRLLLRQATLHTSQILREATEMSGPKAALVALILTLIAIIGCGIYSSLQSANAQPQPAGRIERALNDTENTMAGRS